MSAADRLCAGLRQPEMFHLTLGDESLDCGRHVFDRHIEIDAMLVEQVDDLDAEPLQRRIADLTDVLGPAIHAGVFACLGIDHETELGGDHHLAAHWLQRLADDFLVGERAVDFGGVEEGDAQFHRLTDQLDALLLAEAVVVAEVQSHASQPDGRDFQIAFSKFTFLHNGFLSHCWFQLSRFIFVYSSWRVGRNRISFISTESVSAATAVNAPKRRVRFLISRTISLMALGL